MRHILLEQFRFVRILFGSMVKDLLSHPIVSCLVLLCASFPPLIHCFIYFFTHIIIIIIIIIYSSESFSY